MSRPDAQLDLLVVNPGGRERIYQSLGHSLAAIETPVWCGMLADFVRRGGYSVDILDTNAENIGPRQAAQEISATAPRLVVVMVYGHNPSASTQGMPAASELCESIKQLNPEQPIMLVGGHVAALPGRTLVEEAADYVSAGEGLYTTLDLLAGLRAGRLDCRKVRGLWYQQDGQAHQTAAAPLVDDLDRQMPQLAWDLLPMQSYRAHNWHCFGEQDLERQPYAALYTTLGCPYQCSFCCIQAPFKEAELAAGYPASRNSYRFWSPAAVLNQIDTLVESYGVRNLKLADEMFVLNRRHVTQICDGIIDRGHDLNIWAYARVDSVNDRLLDRLRRAGFRWLCFGIEAGTQSVRDGVGKGIGQQQIIDAMERVREAGIHIGANFIFGLPEDDLVSMQATLDLAFQINAEYANFYCAMAYPGSRLYRQAREQQWALPESWGGYSQHAYDTLPLPTRHLTAEQVLAFRDQAFQSYFGSSRYLDRVASTFGPETVSHITRMSSHPLERKYDGQANRQRA